MRRAVVAVAILAALAACSQTATPPRDSEASAAALKRDCADPQWKQQNLGLWYSVCRKPMSW